LSERGKWFERINDVNDEGDGTDLSASTKFLSRKLECLSEALIKFLVQV
jgi:hypothetical protein